MDKRRRWAVIRGRLLFIIGIASLLVAMFTPTQIPEGLAPLVIVFGVGLVALSIPFRVWRNLPTWLRNEDSWL